MKIDKKFNQLAKSEYFHFIKNYKKYTDFNTLGLYRSIIENEKLNLNDKIEIRDFANTYFAKFFNFLQIKDSLTYFALSTLGQELTVADRRHIFEEIRKNQEKILKKKRIKHRNFGDYSKHNCGYDDCHLNGLMIKKGSWFAENKMFFDSDKCIFSLKNKSKQFKKSRKKLKNIIKDEIDSEL